MAYNPYNPYMGNYYSQYNNAYQNFQQQPQPQMQRQQMPQAPVEMPIQDIRFVTSEEAKAYIVYPNNKVLLIDRQNNIAHLKTADNMGQSSSKTYKFQEVDAEGKALAKDCPNPALDLKDYVKKTDLQTMTDKIYELETRLTKLLNVKQIIGGEGDGKPTSGKTNSVS